MIAGSPYTWGLCLVFTPEGYLQSVHLRPPCSSHSWGPLAVLTTETHLHLLSLLLNGLPQPIADVIMVRLPALQSAWSGNAHLLDSLPRSTSTMDRRLAWRGWSLGMTMESSRAGSIRWSPRPNNGWLPGAIGKSSRWLSSAAPWPDTCSFYTCGPLEVLLLPRPTCSSYIYLHLSLTCTHHTWDSPAACKPEAHHRRTVRSDWRSDNRQRADTHSGRWWLLYCLLQSVISGSRSISGGSWRSCKFEICVTICKNLWSFFCIE